MYYCETCRIINSWPQSIGRSVGVCEVCNAIRPCHDRSSASLPDTTKSKKIAIMPLDGKQYASFTITDFLDSRYCRVKQVLEKSDRRVVLVYSSDDLIDPNADPIIIGTVMANHGEYAVRILWDNKLWRPWDNDTNEFLDIIHDNIKNKRLADTK